MQRQADGKLAPSALDLPATSEWDAAGHGSYGTVQDYGRFVQAWLNDGAGILEAGQPCSWRCRTISGKSSCPS